jgi:hypothetical protein
LNEDPAKIGLAILSECQEHAPCFERDFVVTGTPNDTVYQDIIRDGFYAFALIGDIITNTTGWPYPSANNRGFLLPKLLALGFSKAYAQILFFTSNAPFSQTWALQNTVCKTINDSCPVFPPGTDINSIQAFCFLRVEQK